MQICCSGICHQPDTFIQIGSDLLSLLWSYCVTVIVKVPKAIDRIISQIENSGHPPLISVPAILSSTLTIHGLALFLLMPPVTSEI